MVSLTKTVTVTPEQVQIGDTVFLQSHRGRALLNGKRGSWVKVVATRGTYRDRDGRWLVKFGPAQLQFVQLVGATSKVVAA